MSTVVVAAQQEELAPFVARAAVTRRVWRYGATFREGTLGGAPVILLTTGVGAERAERGLSLLLASTRVARVVIVGVSGGLTPDLCPVAIIAGRRVFDGSTLAAPPDPSWVDRAVRRGALSGTVISTARILGTPAAKAAARSGLGKDLDGGPAAVDLESATYARLAARAGVPYFVVRAICDTAEESLPLDFDAFRAKDGSLRRSQVVLHALGHPSTIGSLWELRCRVRRGSARIAELVEDLLLEPAA